MDAYIPNGHLMLKTWLMPFCDKMEEKKSLFDISAEEINNLRDACLAATEDIIKAEKAFLNYRRTISARNGVVDKCYKNLDSLANTIRKIPGFTKEHARALKISYFTRDHEREIALSVYPHYVRIDFKRLPPATGVNVYARFSEEPDFTFLEYARSSPFLDARRLRTVGVPEIRHYKIVPVTNFIETTTPCEEMTILFDPAKPDSRIGYRKPDPERQYFSRNPVDAVSRFAQFSAALKEISGTLAVPPAVFEKLEELRAALDLRVKAAEDTWELRNYCIAERAASHEKVMRTVRILLNRIGRNANWNTGHARDLGVRVTEQPWQAAKYRPRGMLRISTGYVRVHFALDSADGMNIYTRLAGEEDYICLGIARRSPFKDPRPLEMPGIPEDREYMLKVVVNGKERGQPGELGIIHYEG